MKVRLNPNKKVVSEIKNKLKENGGYCPCSLVKNEDTKCKCKAFRDQVKRGEAGECHCGLWVAEDDQKGTNTSKSSSALTEERLVNKIVKIKDDVKRFCSGIAIPDWVRQSELYVSRENTNGTIMIALSDSCTDYDILMKKDIIATGEERRSIDSECALQNIDVRVMGVPSRIENIKTTQKRLNIPDENIFIDYNREGCLKTAIKAWSKPTDKEFVMVLQDDIELCDNFAECCNKIVEAHPDKIITLLQFLINSRTSARNLSSPYVSLGNHGASGQGIIMRAEWVNECVSGWESSGLRGDDTNISEWAKKTNKEIITTIPATLQHVGDRSVFSPGKVIGKNVLYKKTAYKENWYNDVIIPIKSLLK